jgi:short-subunit dehydrogenase
MRPEELSVVLTGASGGIGAALAELLADEGARVLLVGRRGPPLAALAESFGAHARGRVQALAADVASASGREAIRDIAAARGCNALVNNAALPCFGPFAETAPEQIEAVLCTNLVAPIQLTLALLPQLRAQPQARVLNIGSATGRLGVPGFAVYGAGKFGLRGFSEALRRELADTTVRVQYLGARATRTGFNDVRAEAFNRRTRTAVDEPAAVAEAALRLLLSGRGEKFLGFPESAAVRLNGLAPSLLDGAFGAHRKALRPAAPPQPASPTTESHHVQIR